MDMQMSERTYTFQEITSMSQVKPYVLRFWESEFDAITPVIADDGSKLYTDRDLNGIKCIKKLLFEDKLAIPEAKIQMESVDLGEFIEEHSHKYSSSKVPQAQAVDVKSENNYRIEKQVSLEVMKEKLEVTLLKINEITQKNGWDL